MMTNKRWGQDIVHSKRQHDVRTIEQNSRQSSPLKSTMKLERKVEILLHGTASFAHAHEQQACIHSYGRISLISAEEKKACQYFARDLEILGKNLTIEKKCVRDKIIFFLSFCPTEKCARQRKSDRKMCAAKEIL